MLLQAFTEEFTEYENASLLLLAYNPFLFSIESWADKQYQLLYDSGIKKDPRIHFLPWFPTHDWLPRIYNSAHAFVLPSRGEGFGLPYIEAMACGLPTIGTNWSGNTEFMTKDNSWLIDVEYMEGADMPPFIFPEPGSTWAYPSKDSLKAHMRDIFDNREKATTKALKASEYIHNHFEWKHAAKKAWRYVDDLS
jgi:glycosyltransferase involved in cell wall biosynthesis